MISEKYANMKYKYRNIHFGYRGDYVDTMGRKKLLRNILVIFSMYKNYTVFFLFISYDFFVIVSSYRTC